MASWPASPFSERSPVFLYLFSGGRLGATTTPSLYFRPAFPVNAKLAYICGLGFGGGGGAFTNAMSAGGQPAQPPLSCPSGPAQDGVGW